MVPLVHPAVYARVGLPRFITWRTAHRTPQRRTVRFEATRPVAAALCDAGVLEPGRIPRAWQTLCGIDRFGNPYQSAMSTITGA